MIDSIDLNEIKKDNHFKKNGKSFEYNDGEFFLYVDPAKINKSIVKFISVHTISGHKCIKIIHNKKDFKTTMIILKNKTISYIEKVKIIEEGIIYLM